MMKLSLDQENIQQIANTLLRTQARLESELARVQTELKDVADALARISHAEAIEEDDEVVVGPNGRDPHPG